MWSIDSILVYKNSCVEVVTAKEFRKKLFYCLLVFGVVLIGMSLLSGEQKQKYLEQDIHDLKQQYALEEYKIAGLKDAYNIISEVYIEREKIQRVISAVNPHLQQEEIKLWVTQLSENAGHIEYCLNKNSLSKIHPNDHQYAFNPGISLLLSVGAFESDYNLYSSSRKGAFGPMQLRKVTALSIGVADPKDPADNITGGSKYLCDLLQKYYIYPDQLELALASYNAGRTRVFTKWMPEWGNSWNDINNGLIQSGGSFKETRNYVSSIVSLTRLLVSGHWNGQTKIFWRNYKSQVRNASVAMDYGVTSYSGSGTFR